MDFSNRGQQPRPAATNGNHNVVGTNVTSEPGLKKRDHGGQGRSASKWFSISSIVLLFLITVLVAALTASFAWGNNGQESKYVTRNQYQAVFVNVNGTTGGQVYFGHIKALTSQYVVLTNVFYIQNQSTSSSSSSSSYTLVKLGCELHGPTDQMVINNSQVYFWENLKTNGQVSEKIADYYKANPNGQNCSQSSSSNSTTQASTTPASTSTTPATTTTTTKK